MTPTSANQLTRDKVRIDEKQTATTAAIATKTAVQVPWLERVFRLIETPSKADPETKM